MTTGQAAGGRILHAALPQDWVEAGRSGSYAVSSRGRSLADEGFIHASTRAQLPGVLDRYYADLLSLRLLVLDIGSLGRAGSPVQWEHVPAEQAPYPHVYGPVPVSVVGQGNPVVAVLPLSRRDGEPWRLPDLTAYDLATGP